MVVYMKLCTYIDYFMKDITKQWKVKFALIIKNVLYINIYINHLFVFWEDDSSWRLKWNKKFNLKIEMFGFKMLHI